MLIEIHIDDINLFKKIMNNITFKFNQNYDCEDSIISYFIFIGENEDGSENTILILYDDDYECRRMMGVFACGGCGFYCFEINILLIDNKYYGQVISFDSNPRTDEYENEQYEYVKNGIDNIINLFLNTNKI